jgi:hypothetical protein
MSLQLTYLQTAYLAAETMQALEMLASETEEFEYALMCEGALALLDGAVQTHDLRWVNHALAYAAHVMDGGM